jgi:hypothetical protein
MVAPTSCHYSIEKGGRIKKLVHTVGVPTVILMMVQFDRPPSVAAQIGRSGSN